MADVYRGRLSGRGIVYAATNQKKAEETALNCGEKRDWDCLTCQHTFSSACNSIASGCGCPYCCISVRKLCAAEKACVTCIGKSVASRSDFYRERGIVYAATNIVKAEETAVSCDEKRDLDCKKCAHTFSSACSDIASGTGCPNCKHKTERMVFEFLQSVYPVVIRQPKFEWARSINKLPFDILVGNVLVEVDGAQHFRVVAH